MLTPGRVAREALTKVQPVLSPAKKDEERPLLVDRKEAKRLKRVFKRVLKRVEAKEAVSSQLQPATLLDQVLILKLRCNENVPIMSCLSIRRPWMTLQVWPRAVQPFQGGIQLILQFYNFHIFQSGVRSVHLTSGSRHLGGLPEKH